MDIYGAPDGFEELVRVHLLWEIIWSGVRRSHVVASLLIYAHAGCRSLLEASWPWYTSRFFDLRLGPISAALHHTLLKRDFAGVRGHNRYISNLFITLYMAKFGPVDRAMSGVEKNRTWETLTCFAL
jgi:hypothetical protein